MKTLALSAAFALSALAGFSASASAAEVRTQYPGSACKANTNVNTVTTDFSGKILNAGAAVQAVTCPIIRNVTASTSLEFVAMTIGGPLTSTCTYATVTGTGSISFANPSTIRPIAGFNGFRVQFGDGDANVSAPADRISLLRCMLQPGGSITNYAVVENVNEN